MTERTGDATPSGADPSRPAPEPHADPETTAPDTTPAAPVDAPDQPTPRRRWRIGRQLTIWTILVPLVAVLAGALFSASQGAAQGTDLRSAASGLADVIRDEARRATMRAAEVTRLQDEVASLTELRTDRDEAVAGILDSANRYAQHAGTLPVTGPGVAVSLTDSPLRGDQIPEGLTVDDLVVHQQDVQGVVNALWRGGAEAMMIQDQRIISTSAVRCVGNTLILQGRVYSPPFVITAIGDQGRLQEALANDRSVQIYQEYVAAAGLGYEVEVLDEIEAPAYSGSIGLQHATPIR
ncbi:DUF881 domain-containing protein [Nostocoides sp. F2B08]|uniref:DUF881 domain-containing protein n=1 Tax=Nostocoides sp. F2B08 TaxID=2653936 RepID=UPI00126334AD|nr:DUF881 domain-containing protein [Tetrasphaera sp. F2B08]KAB7745618.1 DUF881 domain-containing protein [Tetrasphaera sp. F2B08]